MPRFFLIRRISGLVRAEDPRQLDVGETDSLACRSSSAGKASIQPFRSLFSAEAAGGEFLLQVDELLHVGQKPAVDPRELEDLLDRHPLLEGVADVEEALGVGDDELLPDLLAGREGGSTSFPSAPNPKRPVSRERSPFWSASLKVRPMDIASPTAFIEVLRVGSAVGKLLEGEAGDLEDAVVDRRLEEGRGLSGDLVHDLVEREAHGQLRRHAGDGEAGRLGGQGRTPREARVDLDDDDLAVVRVHGELDVRPAAGDADLRG